MLRIRVRLKGAISDDRPHFTEERESIYAPATLVRAVGLVDLPILVLTPVEDAAVDVEQRPGTVQMPGRQSILRPPSRFLAPMDLPLYSSFISRLQPQPLHPETLCPSSRANIMVGTLSWSVASEPSDSAFEPVSRANRMHPEHSDSEIKVFRRAPVGRLVGAKFVLPRDPLRHWRTLFISS